MKNRTSLYFWGMVALLNASILVSCSDDTPSITPEPDDTELPDKQPEENPDDGSETDKPGGGSGLTDELLQKIHDIYDHAFIGPQQITTIHQLAILTSYCASDDVAGPITVTPARLNDKEITLITLGGTEEKEGQATTMEESQLASFGKPNDYLHAVTQLFENHIVPREKPVLVTGISLGGMIAQQLLSDSLIDKDYELCGIITFGSPLNVPLDRKGVKVVRFADSHDKVPQLGEIVLRTGLATPNLSRDVLKSKLNELDNQEKIVRTSKYTDMIQTHALSYIDEPCWNDIDFLGSPQKQNILVLTDELKFYPAPKR